jgi:outer membrane lipoprotein-sorting protein
MIRKTVFALTAVVALLFVSASASAQTVDEIIAKNLAAKGGAEKLRALQTLRQTGSVTMQGMNATMTTSFKRPSMNRQEITIMGQNIVMVFDGSKGWMLNPMVGTEPMQMPPEQVEMMKDQSDFDGPLLDYKARGFQVELVGVEDVGGKKGFHLRVSRKTLPPQDLYLDFTTYLEIKMSTTVPGSGVMEVQFGDYRTVDGLTMPYSLKSLAAGMTVSEMKIDKIEFNVKLDDATFKIK